jgi:DNA-binding transcriptional MocR family regulator
LDLIRQATTERLAQDDPYFLQYGLEQGDSQLRRALARCLSRGYGFPVQAESLFITAGVSSALDLICSLYTSPGDTIFVEEPTYHLALRIFRDHRLRIVPLPTDADGLVIEALEKQLVAASPVFLYIIPTFQNPTGRTLSRERRLRLADLSRDHRFLVLADEVYHFLGFHTDPPPAMAAHTEDGHILSLGSFSKILAPGLRLGWIQAGPDHIRDLIGCGLLDSGGGMNPFASAVVRGIVETGALEQNIARLKAAYQSRMSAMASNLARFLPELEYATPQGGYFFWVRFPRGMNAEQVGEKAETFQLRIRPGVLFSSEGGMQDYARLSYVFYEPEEVRQGLIRLRACLDSF